MVLIPLLPRPSLTFLILRNIYGPSRISREIRFAILDLLTPDDSFSIFPPVMLNTRI